jgi:glycosyltransferase involved in cell wall biosynthesis
MNGSKSIPLVSILLPIHNSSGFLPECLKSLINQRYSAIEIIAIDDCSKDNSFKILKEFAKKDKRIRVYKNIKRYGMAVTFNRLAKKSKAKFIAIMGASDISSVDRIKKQMNFVIKNQETAVVGCQCVFIDKKNKHIRKSDFPYENNFIYQSPLHGISMQFETVLINRNLLPKDILKFDVNSKPFMYSDLLMKLLPYGKFANLKKSLYYRRSNPTAYPSDLRKHFPSLLKLWFRSIFSYDYHPSLRSLFSPLAKR